MLRSPLAGHCRVAHLAGHSAAKAGRNAISTQTFQQASRRTIASSQCRKLSSGHVAQSQEKSHRDFKRLDKIGGVWSQEVRLADLIEDFRELQSIEALRDNAQGIASGREYKSAIRALIPLLHSSGNADQVVKMAAMEDVIPKSNGRAWRTIKEKLEHGKIAALEEMDEKTRTLALFSRVNSVGAKRAEKFWDEGFRSLEQLKSRPKLTYAQQMGLQYFEDFEALIPRSEVDAIAKEIFRAIKQADAEHDAEIVGSYRRGEPWSSDVDLVVRHPAFEGGDEDVSKALLQNIVKGFKDIIVLDKPLADGPKRYHTMVKLPGHRLARRLDLRIVGWDDYHYMLLGSTGDLELMKYLRTVAAQRKLFLSEYGMGPRLFGEQRGMQKGGRCIGPHLFPLH
ncbi:Nucleotidyltransferase [Cystobasidium minutum MCA 4210]|uniref:Nucleotidyltransferase n=1 Tax=Cystobasidium minutum MCA 4210 TaxID=1397322 RepID=UPI0034CD6FB5|eukprot:jgi/Rhomi1/203608/MIX4437_8_20